MATNIILTNISQEQREQIEKAVSSVEDAEINNQGSIALSGDEEEIENRIWDELEKQRKNTDRMKEKLVIEETQELFE